jgi:hypothetical protein
MSETDIVSWDDEDLNLDLLLGIPIMMNIVIVNYDEYYDSSFVQDFTQSVVYECPECKVNEKNIWIPYVVKKHHLNLKSMSSYVHYD